MLWCQRTRVRELPEQLPQARFQVVDAREVVKDALLRADAASRDSAFVVNANQPRGAQGTDGSQRGPVRARQFQCQAKGCARTRSNCQRKPVTHRKSRAQQQHVALEWGQAKYLTE